MLDESLSPLWDSWEPEAAWEVRERRSSRQGRKGLPGAGGALETRKPEGSSVGGSRPRPSLELESRWDATVTFQQLGSVVLSRSIALRCFLWPKPHTVLHK